jgi:hypothetical protein
MDAVDHVASVTVLYVSIGAERKLGRARESHPDHRRHHQWLRAVRNTA